MQGDKNMQGDKIYYRGFDSQFANLGSSGAFLWLTDSIDFAREYSKGKHSLAKVNVNILALHYAEEIDIEKLDYDFDYDLYDPDMNFCQHLLSDGYNAYLIYSTHQDEMLCLLDKSLIKTIRILN